jgi:hypothetical protein
MPSKVTPGVALILTLSFLAASAWMLNYAIQTDKSNWDHAVVVYNALTSVGFSAVGVLLGTKVQQGNVDRANADTAQAKQDAAKKTTAIQSALTHLDGASSDEAGGGAVTNRVAIAEAKGTLRQALS